MPTHVRHALLPLACLIVCGLAPTARGQSDPGPLLVPFPEGQNLELSAGALFLERGHIKGGDTPFQLHQFEAAGRFRFTDKFPVNPALGFDALLLDLKTPVETVPRNLSSVALGFATPLKQFENGWYVAAGVGVGYAGEDLFDDSDAYFGKATGIVGKKLDESTSVLIALQYDGNRAIFPDLPLPGFAITKKIDDRLELALGLPFTTLTYRPDDRLTFELTFRVPDSGEASVTYDLTEQFQLFGSFNTFVEPFDVDGLAKVDRLFFEQRRLEAGVTWNPATYVGVTLAAGYAFAQEFSVGFDVRETDKVYEPSDEAYLRAGLVWRP